MLARETGCPPHPCWVGWTPRPTRASPSSTSRAPSAPCVSLSARVSPAAGELRRWDEFQDRTHDVPTLHDRPRCRRVEDDHHPRTGHRRPRQPVDQPRNGVHAGRPRSPGTARLAAVRGRDARTTGDPVFEQFQACETDVDRWVFLTQLHDSNEVLFYRLVGENVHAMLPIVYTPTVGTAIQQFSHLFRRPRGVFLNIDDTDGIDKALESSGLGPDDVDLVVASDAEAILGIGDWGVGGIDISIGKLAVYTVAAGIDPRRVLAVGLDVGTNREELLNDPRYLGLRRSRVRGERYDEFIDTYVASASKRFPKAILHWEDFSGPPARGILARYGDTLCTFDDDIQGTAAVGPRLRLVRRSRLRRPPGRPADRGLRRRVGRCRHRRPDRVGDDRGRAQRGGGRRPHLPARPSRPADQRHGRPLRLPEAVRQGSRRRSRPGAHPTAPSGSRRSWRTCTPPCSSARRA